MRQDIIDLYDEYTHAPLDRHTFLERLARLAGGTAAALAFLPLLENNYAAAEIIAPDDPRLLTGRPSFPGATGDVKTYMAHPRREGTFPAVLVIHENRGLNPHIEDVARRAALAGYFTVAIDALSPFGGTPADQDEARSLIGQLNRDSTIENLVAAATYTKSHRRSTGKLGTVGFCWGGGMAVQTAVHSEDVNAAVGFYGRQPSADETARIKASVMLHYAGIDERINAGISAFRDALEDNGIVHSIYVYEGAQHAFHNDTAPSRYKEDAAQLAWQRTLDFFDKTLKG
jgi:carboxymethylenebutenolidase